MSKIFEKKNIIQKIAIMILIIFIVCFITPSYSNAGFMGDVGKMFIQLFASLGDAVMGLFNHFMLGTDKMVGSIMLDRDTISITDSSGSLYAGDKSADIVLDFNDEEEALDGWLWENDDEWNVPNLLYSPEAIFSNNISTLDVNFLNPNKYTAVEDTANAEKKSKSAASKLKEMISSWYKTFRNIAIVVLLTVLVYIGIRILISSTSSDKAKYKESLTDWFVALLLIAFLHFIMAAMLLINDKVTEIFKQESNSIIVEADGVKMKQNLIGLARLRVQSKDPWTALAFCIIYLCMVGYTIAFTYIYLKRFLYMAFLTMIAPLIAITYPIDKISDGKAQAFSMWFQEYIMNVILQPFHLILYNVLVVSAMDLVKENYIYAIAAIGFLLPAEKFIKKMFKLDRGETASGLSGLASTALAVNGLNKLANTNIKKRDSGKSGVTSTSSNEKLLTGKSEVDGLKSFRGNGQTSNRTVQSNARNTGSAGRNQNSSRDTSAARTTHNTNRNTSAARTTYNTNRNTSTNRTTQSRNMQDIDDDITGDYYGTYDNVNTNDSSSQNTGDIPILNYDDVINDDIVENGEFENINYQPNMNEQDIDYSSENPMESIDYNSEGSKMSRALEVGSNIFSNHKDGVIKGAGKLARGALGTVGMLGGATIGAVEGLVSGGGISGAFKSAAMGGGAGRIVGRKSVDAVSSVGSMVASVPRKIKNLGNAAADNARYIKYGAYKADKIKQERINKEELKRYMKNSDEKKEAKKTQIALSKKGYEVSINEIMKSRYDYKIAGIEDNSEIKRAQVQEYTTDGKLSGDNHNSYIGVLQEASAQGITKSTFNDAEVFDNLHNSFTAALGSEENADSALGLIAKFMDASAGYESQMQRRLGH